ncbi:FAD-binding protein, partial [Aromatoleum sp.]|uniref:FAD-binding protein n=1 Tax=Aromatoleum sp. TaxID=2307007 RepID=UPI002FC8DA64
VTEINEGRGCGPDKDHVLLDITHLSPETIMKRLPGIREISIQFAGVDPIKAPIPVVPTAHYQMGGIPTNFKGQVVAPKDGNPNAPISGFYAAGECACASVHGANRLGTNSLLDLLVFGKSAGESVVEDLRSGKLGLKPLPADAADMSLARLARLEGQKNGESVFDVGLEMRRTMQKHAGVFRFDKLLKEGVAAIMQVAERAKRTEIKDKSKVWNTARTEALELDNLIEVAKATMISAEARKESRGAHVRDDAPDTAEFPNGRNDKEWLKHTLWYSEGNRLDYKPVTIQPLSQDVESIALAKRTY